MTWRRTLTTASTTGLLAYACGLPPPDHTLPVRNPNKACYFRLGDCHLYRNAAHGGSDENDAGLDQPPESTMRTSNPGERWIPST